VQTGYSWETGLIRKLNEDSIFSACFEIQTHEGTVQAGLFAVADGMGGHNAGEVASALAIHSFSSECLSGLLATDPAGTLSIMSEAFIKANSMVLESTSDRSLQGMGTTLTAAIISGQDMYIAHIGDSRCYIINTRETLQVTKDHSVVQQLVDAGMITPEQGRVHPRRNEITRVLGYSRDTNPDLIHIRLYAGDTVLLCSDGLYSVLPDEKIAGPVLDATDLKQACKDLADEANLAGGPDNISVIMARPDNLPSWQALVTAHTSVRIK
jgi:serine/threonine protein phosphatase PrpC